AVVGTGPGEALGPGLDDGGKGVLRFEGSLSRGKFFDGLCQVPVNRCAGDANLGTGKAAGVLEDRLPKVAALIWCEAGRPLFHDGGTVGVAFRELAEPLPRHIPIAEGAEAFLPCAHRLKVLCRGAFPLWIDAK